MNKYNKERHHPSMREWNYNITRIVKEYKDADRKGFVQSIIDDILGDLLWIDSFEKFEKVKMKWKAIRERNRLENYSMYLDNKRDIREVEWD